jgi:hypothetical protein
MQRLSDEQLGAGSSLGRRLVQALRAGRLPATHNETFTDSISVRIPAAAPEVGDLEIVDERDEYTVYVGRHTHTHFMPALMDAPDREVQESMALEDLLEYVGSILSDQVVIWSEPSGSGGTFGVNATPDWLLPDARAWLWSGKAYRRSG